MKAGDLTMRVMYKAGTVWIALPENFVVIENEIEDDPELTNPSENQESD